MFKDRNYVRKESTKQHWQRWTFQMLCPKFLGILKIVNSRIKGICSVIVWRIVKRELLDPDRSSSLFFANKSFYNGSIPSLPWGNCGQLHTGFGQLGIGQSKNINRPINLIWK